jgi:hypothetical protein
MPFERHFFLNLLMKARRRKNSTRKAFCGESCIKLVSGQTKTGYTWLIMTYQYSEGVPRAFNELEVELPYLAADRL